MPHSEAALDAPVEVPARKNLQRSYSSTSVASLPTPPRTRKRKRSGSRHSRATDSGSDSDREVVPGYDSDEDEILERRRKERGTEKDTLVLGHKKRRILQVDAIAAELSGKAAEDAFWGVAEEKALETKSKSEGSSKAHSKEPVRDHSRSQTPDRSPSCSPAAHLLKRNPTGLLSPPQSHRHKSPRVLPFPIPVRAGEPKTPPRRTRSSGRSVRRKLFPQRDSPDNPFLDDAKASDTRDSGHETSGPEAEPSRPHVPAPYIEKPTVTYVFRGVRTEFDNPLYDPRYPETGVAPPGADPDDPSKLPPEHPDFEAEPYCPPKLLFPEAHRRSKRKRLDKATGKGDDSESDDSSNAATSVEEAEEIRPVHAKRKGKEKAGAQIGKERPTGELEKASGTRKEKSRVAGARRPPAKQSSMPPEWESTDDEAGGPDDVGESPAHRVGLPRGFVPKPKEPAPAAKPHVRSGTSKKSEEPSRTDEDGDTSGLRRSPRLKEKLAAKA